MDPKGTAEQRSLCCTRCPESFKDTSALTRHFIQKHGDTPTEEKKVFKCTECPVTYTSQSTLTEHINFKHRGLKRHKCDMCEKSFGWRSAFRQHVENVHKVEMANSRRRKSAGNEDLSFVDTKSIEPPRPKKARINESIQGDEPPGKSNVKIASKENSVSTVSVNASLNNAKDKGGTKIRNATMFAKTIPEKVKLNHRSAGKKNKSAENKQDNSNLQKGSRKHDNINANDNGSGIHTATKSITENKHQFPTNVDKESLTTDRRSFSSANDEYVEEIYVKPEPKQSERDQLLSRREQLLAELRALEQDEDQIGEALRRLEEARKQLEKDLKIKRLNRGQLELELEKYKVALGED